MNNVELIGRLTRDPEIKYTAQTQTAVCTFSLAIDRPTKQGEDKKTDFPRVVVFGKQAESCEKYLKKGALVGVTGKLQTSLFEKDGTNHFKTEVAADRVEFLSRGNSEQKPEPNPEYFKKDDFTF